jgi:hypothetical protein
MPNGYKPYNKAITEHTKINNDPEKLKKKLKSLKEKGRIEIITKEELENFPKGSHVSYVTKKGEYRSGGFLKAIKDEYFVLQGGTKKYPISFPVQFKNVNVMYVKNFRDVKENKEEEDDKNDENDEDE